MFFFYISLTILIYVVIVYILVNVIYKFYRGSGAESMLKGFNDAYKAGLSAKEAVLSNGIGIILSGFILSSVFSLCYFVAAMFILYILMGA